MQNRNLCEARERLTCVQIFCVSLFCSVRQMSKNANDHLKNVQRLEAEKIVFLNPVDDGAMNV